MTHYVCIDSEAPKKREFFTISIVGNALKKAWRNFVDPQHPEAEKLPEKYTFSFLKALHMLQADQVGNNEQVRS